MIASRSSSEKFTVTKKLSGKYLKDQRIKKLSPRKKESTTSRVEHLEEIKENLSQSESSKTNTKQSSKHDLPQIMLDSEEKGDLFNNRSDPAQKEDQRYLTA